jgi:Secretion system C-terminal sorting domain
MRLITIVLTVVIHASIAVAQPFNIRLSFGTGTPEVGFSCYEVADRYVFVAGYNDEIAGSRGGAFSLDFDGNILDSNVFFQDSTVYYLSGASGGDTNGEIIVAGGIIILPPDLTRIGIVVGFNQLGDTLFTHKYLSPNSENVRFYKGLITDSGYLGCGTVDNINEEDLGSGILVKFDLEGNFLWRQDYTPQNNLSVFLYSADQTPDGGYLLGGSRISGENNDHLVIKTDSLGNEEWRKVEGNQYQNGTAMVANTNDGNYIFCGWNSPNTTYNSYPQVTKLDQDGEVIWTNNYGNLGVMKYAFSIKLLDDGGFVFCGSDRLQGILYGQIRKIDADGNEIWYRRYTHTDGIDCWFNDVTPTSDGGYILTGILGSDADLGIEQDMWAMKVDSYGCLVPGCQFVHVDENTPAALSVYPNPCADFINVYVESLNLDQCELQLFDTQGRLVRNAAVNTSGSTWIMESSTLPEGLYVLQLHASGRMVASERVVVRR